MKALLKTLVAFVFLCLGCRENKTANPVVDFIGTGQMPNIARDQAGLHVVYGSGDSLLYTISADAGKTFAAPVLIAVLPKLAASHTRGPQIAATRNGLVVTACTAAGNIFSFHKEVSSVWSGGVRVNDRDTTAKENLMALSGDGAHAFAVWLDLRSGHNAIWGAKSEDGGKSWSENRLVYASPDTTVCECCKPSVVVNGEHVYVLFRNQLNGVRDMYLSTSADGGHTFGPAQKMGLGQWPLNACPMDGGGLALHAADAVQTVWYRAGDIYTNSPGERETAIGKGRNCTIETVAGKPVCTWTEGGAVVVLKPTGEKITLGKGTGPVLKALDNATVICVWEEEKQLRKAVLKI